MLLPIPPDAPAFLYLRKSRDEGTDPDALRRHRSTLLQCAAEDGVEIPLARQFEDIGSGERIAARPAFRGLLDAWRALPTGSGGVAYVMDVDRLSRGILTERGQVQDLLLRAGILIRTPAELIDLRQPAQGLLYEIKGSLARHELLIYKQRIAGARADMLRRGQIRTGRVPIGYRWSKDEQQPVPGARFPVLQAICRDALHLSLNRLAEKYSVAAATVWLALTNPMICGWPAQRFGTDPETGRPIPLPRSEWIWPEQPGDYPAACSRVEWEQIQVRLQQRFTRRGKTTGANGWCRDVVRFVGLESFPCRLGAQDGTPTYELKIPGHSLLYVPRAPVHTAVENALLALLNDRHALSRSVAAYRAARALEASGGPLPGLGALRQEVDRREEESARLLRRELLADAADAESIRRVRHELKQELAVLHGQLQALAGALPPAPAMDAWLLEIGTLAPEVWIELWQQDLDEETRRAIVTALIVCVPVRVTGEKWKHKRREVLPVEWHPWLNSGK